MEKKWPNNLEAQSQVVSAILAKLIDSGIVKTTISASDFSSEFVEAGYPEKFDSDGLLTDLLNWLQDEEIVRHDGGYQGDDETVFECVITGKGMHLLQTKSEILGGKTPLEIVAGNKTGDSSAKGFVQVGALLGGMMGGFTKAIS